MKIDIEKSQKENAKLLGVTPSYISVYCKNHNIKLKDTRGKIGKVNKNPFELGCPNNDYWLGYLLGDGGMSRQGSNIYIYTKDLEIVESFKKHCPLVNIYLRNEIYSIYFGNKIIWNYLYSLGITPKKALTLDINFELNWNIIRGLFDSDGSISRGQFKITSGSLFMIDKLDEFFKKFSFTTRIVQKGNAFDIFIRYTKGSRNKDEALVEKRRLFAFLYSDCEFFMGRKRVKFSALL